MKPSDDIEPVDLDTAIKLGKEALKAWRSSRQFSSVHQFPLLPGETKD